MTDYHLQQSRGLPRLAPHYDDPDLDGFRARLEALAAGRDGAHAAVAAAEAAVVAADDQDVSAAADAMRAGTKAPAPTVDKARDDLDRKKRSLQIADRAFRDEHAELARYVADNHEQLTVVYGARLDDARRAWLAAVDALRAADEALTVAEVMHHHVADFPKPYNPPRRSPHRVADRPVSTLCDELAAVVDRADLEAVPDPAA